MKKVLLLFALLLIIIGGLVLVQNYLKEGGVSFFKKTSIIVINNQSFKVAVADSQRKWEIGLSETKSLQKDQGMIFLFDKSDYYSFWMKKIKILNYIIYINKKKKITIKKNVQLIKDKENPIIYSSTQPANKVLEIQAGLSEKYNFKKGDKVQYENLGN